MAGDFNDLCDVGISYPLAAEIGRQAAAGVGNPNLLCLLGLNAGPAIELASQITSGAYSDDKLARAMWNPITAAALNRVLGAPSFANGQVAPAGYHWDFVTMRGERIEIHGSPWVQLVKNGVT